MEAIKLFFTSSAVENGGAFSGIIQMLWAFIEQLGELLKYVPELLAMLPWWLMEIILLLLFAVGIPLLIKFIEFIKLKWPEHCDRLTKGSFDL